MTAAAREPVVARLRFRDKGESGGEWVVNADGTVQLVPSEGLRAAMARVTDRVDENALKWGASLVVGVAAVGAALFLNGRRKPAYGVFALSGAAGWAAKNARRGIRNWGTGAFRPRPARQVNVVEDAEGLSIAVRYNGHAPNWTMRLAPGDYDPAEAARFIAELERNTEA